MGQCVSKESTSARAQAAPRIPIRPTSPLVVSPLPSPPKPTLSMKPPRSPDKVSTAAAAETVPAASETPGPLVGSGSPRSYRSPSHSPSPSHSYSRAEPTPISSDTPLVTVFLQAHCSPRFLHDFETLTAFATLLCHVNEQLDVSASFNFLPDVASFTLEGAAPAVAAVVAMLRSDPRLNDVSVLLRAPIVSERLFSPFAYVRHHLYMDLVGNFADTLDPRPPQLLGSLAWYLHDTVRSLVPAVSTGAGSLSPTLPPMLTCVPSEEAHGLAVGRPRLHAVCYVLRVKLSLATRKCVQRDAGGELIQPPMPEGDHEEGDWVVPHGPLTRPLTWVEEMLLCEHGWLLTDFVSQLVAQLKVRSATAMQALAAEPSAAMVHGLAASNLGHGVQSSSSRYDLPEPSSHPNVGSWFPELGVACDRSVLEFFFQRTVMSGGEMVCTMPAAVVSANQAVGVAAGLEAAFAPNLCALNESLAQVAPEGAEPFVAGVSVAMALGPTFFSLAHGAVRFCKGLTPPNIAQLSSSSRWSFAASFSGSSGQSHESTCASPRLAALRIAGPPVNETLCMVELSRELRAMTVMTDDVAQRLLPEYLLVRQGPLWLLGSKSAPGYDLPWETMEPDEVTYADSVSGAVVSMLEPQLPSLRQSNTAYESGRSPDSGTATLDAEFGSDSRPPSAPRPSTPGTRRYDSGSRGGRPTSRGLSSFPSDGDVSPRSSPPIATKGGASESARAAALSTAAGTSVHSGGPSGSGSPSAQASGDTQQNVSPGAHGEPGVQSPPGGLRQNASQDGGLTSPVGLAAFDAERTQSQVLTGELHGSSAGMDMAGSNTATDAYPSGLPAEQSRPSNCSVLSGGSWVPKRASESRNRPVASDSHNPSPTTASATSPRSVGWPRGANPRVSPRTSVNQPLHAAGASSHALTSTTSGPGASAAPSGGLANAFMQSAQGRTFEVRTATSLTSGATPPRGPLPPNAFSDPGLTSPRELPSRSFRDTASSSVFSGGGAEGSPGHIDARSSERTVNTAGTSIVRLGVRPSGANIDSGEEWVDDASDGEPCRSSGASRPAVQPIGSLGTRGSPPLGQPARSLGAGSFSNELGRDARSHSQLPHTAAPDNATGPAPLAGAGRRRRSSVGMIDFSPLSVTGTELLSRAGSRVVAPAGTYAAVVANVKSPGVASEPVVVSHSPPFTSFEGAPARASASCDARPRFSDRIPTPPIVPYETPPEISRRVMSSGLVTSSQSSPRPNSQAQHDGSSGPNTHRTTNGELVGSFAGASRTSGSPVRVVGGVLPPNALPASASLLEHSAVTPNGVASGELQGESPTHESLVRSPVSAAASFPPTHARQRPMRGGVRSADDVALEAADECMWSVAPSPSHGHHPEPLERSSLPLPHLRGASGGGAGISPHPPVDALRHPSSSDVDPSTRHPSSNVAATRALSRTSSGPASRALSPHGSEPHSTLTSGTLDRIVSPHPGQVASGSNPSGPPTSLSPRDSQKILSAGSPVPAALSSGSEHSARQRVVSPADFPARSGPLSPGTSAWLLPRGGSGGLTEQSSAPGLSATSITRTGSLTAPSDVKTSGGLAARVPRGSASHAVSSATLFPSVGGSGPLSTLSAADQAALHSRLSPSSGTLISPGAGATPHSSPPNPPHNFPPVCRPSAGVSGGGGASPSTISHAPASDTPQHKGSQRILSPSAASHQYTSSPVPGLSLRNRAATSTISVPSGHTNLPVSHSVRRRSTPPMLPTSPSLTKDLRSPGASGTNDSSGGRRSSGRGGPLSASSSAWDSLSPRAHAAGAGPASHPFTPSPNPQIVSPTFSISDEVRSDGEHVHRVLTDASQVGLGVSQDAPLPLTSGHQAPEGSSELYSSSNSPPLRSTGGEEPTSAPPAPPAEAPQRHVRTSPPGWSHAVGSGSTGRGGESGTGVMSGGSGLSSMGAASSVMMASGARIPAGDGGTSPPRASVGYGVRSASFDSRAGMEEGVHPPGPGAPPQGGAGAELENVTAVFVATRCTCDVNSASPLGGGHGPNIPDTVTPPLSAELMNEFMDKLGPVYRDNSIGCILVVMYDCLFLLLEGPSKGVASAAKAWDAYGLAVTAPGADPLPNMENANASLPQHPRRGHGGLTLLRRVSRAKQLIARPFAVLIFRPADLMNPLLTVFRILVPTVEALAALASPYAWDNFTLYRAIQDDTFLMHSSVMGVNLRVRPMPQFVEWLEREKNGIPHPADADPSNWWPQAPKAVSGSLPASQGTLCGSLAAQTSAIVGPQVASPWLGSLARDLAHDEAIEWGMRAILHFMDKGGRLDRILTGMTVTGDTMQVSVCWTLARDALLVDAQAVLAVSHRIAPIDCVTVEEYLAECGVNSRPPIPNAGIPLQLEVGVSLVRGLMRVSVRGHPAAAIGPLLDVTTRLAESAPPNSLVLWPPAHLDPPQRFQWTDHVIALPEGSPDAPGALDVPSAGPRGPPPKAPSGLGTAGGLGASSMSRFANGTATASASMVGTKMSGMGSDIPPPAGTA